MVSDISIVAASIALAVGIVLGYEFRELIAREEKKALAEAENAYQKLLDGIRAKARSAVTKL